MQRLEQSGDLGATRAKTKGPSGMTWPKAERVVLTLGTAARKRSYQLLPRSSRLRLQMCNHSGQHMLAPVSPCVVGNPQSSFVTGRRPYSYWKTGIFTNAPGHAHSQHSIHAALMIVS